ncbi:tudor domain-containing protein 5-like [Wyeomyia smithii]|uniref:tudor domain-containing protein 5-like n=1 Tax=Wyeomyia smithii TaxID=174621 RepID=UPI002467C7B1|nr:tudor domain-containing protein 5-like [Wyeomyia smithii]
MDGSSMEEIKQLIRSLAISGATNGLTAKDLANDFKKMEGFDLPYQRLGFRSVDQFLHTLKDTVKVIGNGPTALVQPVLTDSNKHIRKLVESGKNFNGKRRPRQSYPNTNYQPRKSYNNSSNYSNGFSNFARRENIQIDQSRKVSNREYDYCDTNNGNSGSDSSDSAPVFKMTNEKKLELVCNSPAKIVREFTQKKHQKNDAIPDGHGLQIINSLEIPKDAMSLGDVIAEPKIPDSVVPKQSLQIFATEVHNPNRFWFHMGGCVEKIDELMNDIETFYTHLQREEWRMQPSNVVVGMYCVAKFLGLWHRARIVSEYAHNHVKLFYIDYGTVAELELKDIKYMAKCFASLPAQAMRASLAYVKPVNHRWSRDASWSLLSLVYEKILYAYIVDVDRKTNVVDVVLIDTSGPQDIVVNQQLFVKGHAIWEDDLHYKDKSTEEFRNRIKSYCELFPRFEDIENAKYPALLELGEFQSEGFNFDHYYTQSLRTNSDYTRHIVQKTFNISSKLIIQQDIKPFETHSSNQECERNFSEETDFESQQQQRMFQRYIKPFDAHSSDREHERNFSDEVNFENQQQQQQTFSFAKVCETYLSQNTVYFLNASEDSSGISSVTNKAKRKQVRFMEPDK